MKALLIAAAAMALAMPAYAQCGLRDAFVMALDEMRGEERRSIGITPDNKIMEFYANLETGSWTVLLITVDGIACIVGHGASYSEFGSAPNAAAPKGDPV